GDAFVVPTSGDGFAQRYSSSSRCSLLFVQMCNICHGRRLHSVRALANTGSVAGPVRIAPMNSAQFVQIERELSRLGVTVYGVGEWGGAVYVWIPDGLGDTRAVRLDPEA